eukprot:gene1759-6659_t
MSHQKKAASKYGYCNKGYLYYSPSCSGGRWTINVGNSPSEYRDSGCGNVAVSPVTTSVMPRAGGWTVFCDGGDTTMTISGTDMATSDPPPCPNPKPFYSSVTFGDWVSNSQNGCGGQDYRALIESSLACSAPAGCDCAMDSAITLYTYKGQYVQLRDQAACTTTPKPCPSNVAYTYTWGDWYSTTGTACGGGDRQDQTERCPAPLGCSCINQYLPQSDTRQQPPCSTTAPPCPATAYEYEFQAWVAANPGETCGGQDRADEKQVCNAPQGCACTTNQRAPVYTSRDQPPCDTPCPTTSFTYSWGPGVDATAGITCGGQRKREEVEACAAAEECTCTTGQRAVNVEYKAQRACPNNAPGTGTGTNSGNDNSSSNSTDDDNAGVDATPAGQAPERNNGNNGNGNSNSNNQSPPTPPADNADNDRATANNEPSADDDEPAPDASSSRMRAGTRALIAIALLVLAAIMFVLCRMYFHERRPQAAGPQPQAHAANTAAHLNHPGSVVQNGMYAPPPIGGGGGGGGGGAGSVATYLAPSGRQRQMYDDANAFRGGPSGNDSCGGGDGGIAAARLALPPLDFDGYVVDDSTPPPPSSAMQERSSSGNSSSCIVYATAADDVQADVATGTRRDTAWAGRDLDAVCQRGLESGGRPCHRPVVRSTVAAAAAAAGGMGEGRFCEKHTCGHAGCSASKSSKAKTCQAHAATLAYDHGHGQPPPSASSGTAVNAAATAADVPEYTNAAAGDGVVTSADSMAHNYANAGGGGPARPRSETQWSKSTPTSPAARSNAAGRAATSSQQRNPSVYLGFGDVDNAEDV